MARTFKEYYEPEFKVKQQAYYKNLSEKQARHFLAMEYLRLGVGSQRYLARTFSCSRDRILKGVRELVSSDFKADYTRQRKAGGGRKKRGVDPGVD